LDAIVALNTSVARRVQHRLMMMMMMIQQQQQ
jgi:hypothetical protein